MPFATAFADIAAMLKDFFSDNARRDWLTVERCDPAILPTEEELLRRLRGQSPELRSRLAATAVMYARPHSPLLAAFALHQAVAHFPGRLYHSGLRAALEQAGLIRENEPDLDAARRLYAAVIAEKTLRKDAPGRQLAENLLAALPREHSACPA